MFRKIKAQLLALECRVDRLSVLCYELKMQLDNREAGLETLTERYTALQAQVDELRADAEGREASEKAEWVFTEGVANILSYEIGGRK